MHEVTRIDSMMPRQAFHGGAVGTPIVMAQCIGVIFVKLEVIHDVLRHGLIHHRKDVGGCVM